MWPVAQNGHPTAQPTWLLTQTVDRRRESARAGVSMATVSMVWPSPRRQSSLMVSPPSARSSVRCSRSRTRIRQQARAAACRQLEQLVEVADERLPYGCLYLASTPGRLALARERVEDCILAGGAQGTSGHSSMVRASTSAAVNHVGCPDERGSRRLIGVPRHAGCRWPRIIGLSIYTRVDRDASGRRPIHWGHVALGRGCSVSASCSSGSRWSPSAQAKPAGCGWSGSGTHCATCRRRGSCRSMTRSRRSCSASRHRASPCTGGSPR